MSLFTRIFFTAVALLVVLSTSNTNAFVRSSGITTRFPSVQATAKTTNTVQTALFERRWNFNDGQGPWGLKKNAEIWNGRMAQMCFVFVLIQELIQGKGVVEGLQQGDPLNLACAGIAAVSIVGLTGFLALKGSDDYVDRELQRRK